MKTVKLFYNPGSGNGNHTQQKLVRQIESGGFSCKHVVKKKQEVGLEASDFDILAIAGGDGTVRKAALHLLNGLLQHNRPIGLLAHGTANNIANTLGIAHVIKKDFIASWKKDHRKSFDIGCLTKGAEKSFFLESFGFGVFPRLMKEMSKLSGPEPENAAEEFDIALDLLFRIAESYKALDCKLSLDGKDYSGKYLLVEMMNIKSVGSNMRLAPDADPGDGKLDVVLVPEDARLSLLTYIENARRNIGAPFPFEAIRAEEVMLHRNGRDTHLDDQVIKKYKAVPQEIKLLKGMLEFLVMEKPVVVSKTK